MRAAVLVKKYNILFRSCQVRDTNISKEEFWELRNWCYIAVCVFVYVCVCIEVIVFYLQCQRSYPTVLEREFSISLYSRPVHCHWTTILALKVLYC